MSRSRKATSGSKSRAMRAPRGGRTRRARRDPPGAGSAQRVAASALSSTTRTGARDRRRQCRRVGDAAPPRRPAASGSRTVNARLCPRPRCARRRGRRASRPASAPASARCPARPRLARRRRAARTGRRCGGCRRREAHAAVADDETASRVLDRTRQLDAALRGRELRGIVQQVGITCARRTGSPSTCKGAAVARPRAPAAFASIAGSAVPPRRDTASIATRSRRNRAGRGRCG